MDGPLSSAWERVAISALIAVVFVSWIVTNPVRTSGGGRTVWSDTGSSSACSGSANTPGGADPWGGCWPGLTNTGVPAGTSLTSYAGPCVVTTDDTVINAKTVDCSPDPLSIHASNVTITNSNIVCCGVYADTDLNTAWSFSLTDSEVYGGAQDFPTTGVGNATILRAKLHGGHNGMQCDNRGPSGCSITDSYIYGQYQPATGDSHLGGILTDGLDPAAHFTISHNSVFCDAVQNVDGGGCSGDINLIPNFDYAHDITVYRNLLGANIDNPYCTLGGEKLSSSFPHGFNIAYTQNVFQKGVSGQCGVFGPVTDWNGSGTGNSATGNVWDDGTTLTFP